MCTACAHPAAGDLGWADAKSYAPANSSPSKGRVIAQTRCAACHGVDGNSGNPQYPKLAGQDPTYLYSQLRAYRTENQSSAIMAAIATSLSAVDATDVVGFYAAQVIRPDPVKDQALAAEGNRIFHTAIGSGMVSECAACHDGGRVQQMPMMMGHQPTMGQRTTQTGAIPKLYGQHAAYILDRLNRFASGQLPSTSMDSIAATLDEQQRKAVAIYLSGLQ